MTISMYNASVPVFVRMLTNLSAILDKGAQYAQAKKFDPDVLVQSRLAPDMFPLSRQVQIAGDIAKGCAARLSGAEPPKYEDDEKTLPELKARIEKTVAYLNTFKPKQIDGTEDKTIQLPLRGQTMTFKGLPYLLNFALPNVYFHVTAAYLILRHNGVEVGKQDFLGSLQP
ncbi:MAG TPA: DUF1993 domain-containing protein [Gammaproteobacteria bacterium]|nr:DUF1993 domain-containing protein [Gammaproteobacteria bacterium]